MLTLPIQSFAMVEPSPQNASSAKATSMTTDLAPDSFSSKPTRDDTFYLDFIIFLVEGRLFRVPRHIIEDESPVFSTMFQLPVAEGSSPDGLRDDQPLSLSGVTASDFRILLAFLYQRKPPTDRPGWVTILNLADMWDMQRLRTEAISSLSDIISDPAERIAVARTHLIDEWLLPAFSSLVTRDAPVGMEDAKYLGFECALQVAALRERCHLDWGAKFIMAETRRNNRAVDSTAVISETFGLSLPK